MTAPEPARARELFWSRFSRAPDGVWLAPGRANLMGEHTDYNEGYVLPFALGQGVTAAAARRAGGRLALCSRQKRTDDAEIAIEDLAPGSVTGWAAYPAGVVWALREAGYQLPGAAIAVDSDLPAGAGLSSSAALECAAALALTELAGPSAGTVPRADLAAIARRAENEFVGVPCGIMDQFASLLCQPGHALLLDCRSRDSSQVPFDPAQAGSRLLLINTRARHNLAAGEYGRRRAECEQAARQLGVPSLRYLTDPGETSRLPDDTLRRRARHVVTDNRRVLEVAALLRSAPGDAYPEIGRLLTQAHLSLRDDFEVSWPEADTAVQAALAAGALGARMIGGGFGGSVLALVPATACGQVRDAVTAAFARQAWTRPDFLAAVPSGSARRLELQWGLWLQCPHECGADSQGPSPRARRTPVLMREEAARITGQLAELRHAIHREPEIGLDLPKTQQKVLGALDGLPLEISTGQGLSSVTAVLRGGAGGPVVLLRGDMDALPVTEETHLPYASAVPGAMHACGHDLHTAMLAGAARLLSGRKADLPGTVIFMFQPGEEGCAGARHMIGEGVLEAAGERPVAAYALHVTSNRLPCGVFSTRPGPMLAAADRITVTVHGRGGHASTPHRAADPIIVACEMVTALQALVTRKFDVFDPVVITVGSFHAGTRDNVIPDQARFWATARSFSREARGALAELVPRLIGDIARAHGLTAEADYAAEYPVTVNDAAEAGFATGTIAAVFGPGRAETAQFPITGAEDFSFVLEQVPGAFVMLGACPPGRDPETAPANHSPVAVFDDAALADGAALYAELALRRLAEA